MSDLVSPELEAQAVAWRRHLHANPELSFEEHETSRFVERTLRAIGAYEIERPTATSVVARLRGDRPGKVLALRADIDALPIHEETGLPFASLVPGVMHACGHDGHTAMLLAAATLLAERRAELGGEVRLVFQHAEEVPPGGARELVAAGVMDGVDLVVGAHLMSGYPLGQVVAQPGPLLAASDTIAVEVRGSGGHAAYPHTTADPMVAAARAIAALQHVVAREVDPLDSAVVSVTQVHGGVADNVIPESVSFRGTVRTLRASTRAAVRTALERILRGVGEAHGVRIELSYQEGYDAVVNDPEVAAVVESAARREVGEEALARVSPVMGGEDFSAYLAAAPGAFFFVGTRSDDPATAVPHHHPLFAIDEAALRTGIAVLTRTALDVLSN
ncbi:MAG TPA: amidohydrolase [Gaiellaceae bacterium]|nr:amidohydrolase [Gaiellaceae bacterium]